VCLPRWSVSSAIFDLAEEAARDAFAVAAERWPRDGVPLNRAVAVAQAGSTEQALEIVDGLDLDDYPYLHATRGELLRRLGAVPSLPAT
jgi:predicted RNA polymerase sigma factor